MRSKKAKPRNGTLRKQPPAGQAKKSGAVRNQSPEAPPVCPKIGNATRPSLKKQSEEENAMTTQKREGYLSWDQYFMGVALLSAQRSKDPGSQVGACIVNSDNRILSVGYNGMPTGCQDDQMPWAREGDFLESKYAFVCHAELNAILNNDGGSLKGTRLYATLFPCNECAKAIIQSGIREVIYLSDKYAGSDAVIASKRMFQMAGVALRQYQPEGTQITLEL